MFQGPRLTIPLVTVFPHIRPAGIIFLQELRVLLEFGHVFQEMSLNDQF